MATATEHENSIVNRLAATDPQLSTALGTPIRKLIEAVSMELANLSNDVTATSTLYSLNAVSGQDLDYLVGQFGFTRQEARYSRGVIRLSRDNGDAVLQIPYGSQFYKPATSTSRAVSFQTLSYQELGQGVLTAEVPVACTTVGSIGNVAANTVTRSTGYSSYISCTNEEAMSGGRDAETDEQLRQRFLDTVFRNESSTRDQYIALASANANVSRVQLVGQSSRYTETVQAESSGNNIVASVTDAKFALDVRRGIDKDNRYWVTLTDSDTLLGRGEYVVSNNFKTVTFQQQFASEVVGPTVLGGTLELSHKNISNVTVTLVSDPSAPLVLDTDYTLDLTNGTITVKATSTVISAGDALSVSYYYDPVSVGEFVTIEFDYVSLHNRDTLKSVDVYIDGTNPTLVTDVEYIDCTKVISGSNSSTWERADGSTPDNGHVYVPLAYQPLISSGGAVRAISMGVSMMLTEGVHFYPIWDVSSTRGTHGSTKAIDAIELIGTVGQDASLNTIFTFTAQSNGTSIIVYDQTPMAIPYYYDEEVWKVQQLLDQQSVLTSDTLVHEAKGRRFSIYLTLMFSSFPRDAVISQVQSAVANWMTMLPFGQTIQISDIETVAAGVAGVDNVRLATQSDAGNHVGEYGIIEYERDDFTVIQTHTTDILLAQNEVAIPLNVVCYSLAQRTW